MEELPRSSARDPIPYGAPLETLRIMLGTSPPECWPAYYALARAPERAAFDLLLAATGDPDHLRRRTAAEAISFHALGAEAVSRLVALLSDPAAHVVRTACESLARLRAAAVHDGVLALAASSADPWTRQVALRALERLGRAEDVDRLARIFTTDPSDDVRKRAAWTLHALASSGTWERLFDLWQRDALGRHRLWACELATRFGPAGKVDDLRRLLADPDGHVRGAATKALAAESSDAR